MAGAEVGDSESDGWAESVAAVFGADFLVVDSRVFRKVDLTARASESDKLVASMESAICEDFLAVDEEGSFVASFVAGLVAGASGSESEETWRGTLFKSFDLFAMEDEGALVVVVRGLVSDASASTGPSTSQVGSIFLSEGRSALYRFLVAAAVGLS